MLKRLSLRKISVTTTALLIMGLLYLFPSNEIEIEENVNYISEENLKEVFLIDDNNYISEVMVNIEESEIIDILKRKISLITINSIDNESVPKHFKPIIPENTKINDIKIEDDTCTIDFSKELLNVLSVNEEKMIESIVFTLTSEKEVNKVIIKVDGSVLERLPNSNKLLPNVLDRSYGINKKYDINGLYNLTKTTVYYVNEIDDNTYYVPVTLVNNSSDEKISIIVSELKSSILYQSNLSSYLNSNTELKKYEQEEEVMNLTFNDKIFNSIYDKNIIEEVVYTIGKSVLENYEVKSVNFYVNDELIEEFNI